MALNLSEGSSFTPVPAGLHNAICTAVVDLGMQEGKFGIKPQLLIQWELPDCAQNKGVSGQLLMHGADAA